MLNKFLLFAIIVLLCLALAGVLTHSESVLTAYSGGFLTVATDMAILMLLVNGTFISSRYSKVAFAFILLVIIGIIFKILHLPGADQLLLFSYPALWLVYFIHFLSKKPKTLLDVLKVLTLLFFLIKPLLSSLRLISIESREVLLWINHLFLWSTFLYFMVTKYREKILFK
jgi:hypothetical protein